MAEQCVVGEMMEKLVYKIIDFVGSGVFALMILLTVLLWSLVMLAILAWPQSFTSSAAWAATFRIWCFGYNPATGEYNIPQLIMLVLDPLFLGGIVFVVWKKGILDLFLHRRKAVVKMASASLLMVAAALFSIAQVQAAKLGDGKALRDEQLLRRNERAPRFLLKDQNGAKFVAPSPGEVTIVTAFYAHCQHTCPQIIEQARRALKKSKIEEGRVQLALITLDPENDTVEALKAKAVQLGLPANWHLLTGDPIEVNRVLDRFEVSRLRDANGNIGHSNVFYVIDKKGDLAFRIGLGSAQEAWLREAIELLEKEKTGG